MKSTTITTIIIAAVVIVGGIILYQQQGSENTSEPTATTTASTSTDPDSWSQYRDGDLSFSHPSAADISKEAGRTKIQILGDDNEPNTEVTDGITAYISTTTLAENGLQETAETLSTERQETSQEVLAEVASSTFAGLSGYSFELRNQLGFATTYYVLPATDELAYTISYTASGADSNTYVNTFEDIVASLKYDEENGDVSNDTETSTTTPPGDSTNRDDDKGGSLAEACQQAGGNWLAEYNECEISDRNWCSARNGSFNDCASACRHNPDADLCTQECVFVCSF
jgi:hypothetical protein